MSFFYPKLDPTVLQNIDLARQLAQENPSYFSALDCTYDQATKDWLIHKGPAILGDAEAAALDAPETEAESLLKYLKAMKDNLPETNDKLAYVRASATLLDKIVIVQERAFGVKRQKEFEETVMNFMQDVLSPEQRTLLMDRLKNAGL